MQKFDSERRERRRSTNARSLLSLSYLDQSWDGSWRSRGPLKTPKTEGWLLKAKHHETARKANFCDGLCNPV
jgi:hypothetical protein